MRVAAVVIVYHPDKDEFVKNLNAYIDAVDVVIVWLNSREDWIVRSEFGNRLVFMGKGENEYMAKPLNEAIAWCKKYGYDYLLTMDQDSLWVNCAQYIRYVKEHCRKNVAIYAPDVNHQSEEWRTDKEEYLFNSVITSGSLCNVKVVNQLGGFREDYQIYWVDEEFCLWARMNGYEIVVLPRYQIKQQFGKLRKTKWGFSSLNYSPRVYYFLVRNALWMKRNHYDSPSVRFICYKLFVYLRGIALSEEQKAMKLKMVFNGIKDGLLLKIENRIKLNVGK